jgi:hypothetical protein
MPVTKPSSVTSQIAGVVPLKTTGRPELAEAVSSKPSAESVVFVGGTVFCGSTMFTVWSDLVTVITTSSLVPALNVVVTAVVAATLQVPTAKKVSWFPVTVQTLVVLDR